MSNTAQKKSVGKLYGSLALLATLAGCGGGGGAADSNAGATSPLSLTGDRAQRTYPASPIDCSLPEMRNWVQANMYDYYLFYDQVGQVNLNDYGNVETLIDDLRVLPFDKFSYISDAQASTALFEEGKLQGYGWKLRRTSQSDVRIAFVYPRSPLAEHNVNRGDFLLAINGVHPLEMSADQWEEFLGVGDEVKTPTFTLLDTAGNQRDIVVTRTEFEIDTVLEASVLPLDGATVGYLAFTQFLETSNQELDTAFAGFSQQGVDELVLDMRYNGGGRISVANNLASKIAGPAYAGQIFAEISFNDKFNDEDIPFQLGNALNSLSLDRVVVLSSASTCSASEMVINGLKPFIDVVQIGGTSCGKPYGSSPNQACGKQMSALQFEFVNANGVGDYYDGIPADCAADDDTNFALGNPQEGMLKAGLDFISNGSCNAVLANTPDAQARTQTSEAASRSGIQSLDPLLDEMTIAE